MTGGTAETLAKNSAATAVIAALTPICVEKFQQAADASANLAEMKKAGYAWDQSKFVEKGGWATMPGSTEPNSAVAKACAESLGRGKLRISADGQASRVAGKVCARTRSILTCPHISKEGFCETGRTAVAGWSGAGLSYRLEQRNR